MKNIEVIKKFLQEEGKEDAKTKHLYIDSKKRQLINYNTVIAEINGFDGQEKEIVIDVNYYSRTTSKIQSYIIRTIRELREQGKILIVVLDGAEKRVEQYTKILQA